MEEYTIFLVSVASALIMSHLCSLMEAALLSITPSQLGELRLKSPQAGRLAVELKRDIEKPIAVILIINTAAHTIGAAIAGASFNTIFKGAYMTLFSLVFTLLMVQYTEILPKTLGVRCNVTVMRFAVRPLSYLIAVMKPLIWLTHRINRPFERKTPAQPTTTQEISALAALARSSQVISSRQERIIRMVPHLSEKTAEEVMIDVANISFLDSAITLSDAITATGNDFHTRYPVCFDRDRNKVIGYVNIKELVLRERTGQEDEPLSSIVRPISFVAPTDTAAELLEMFAAQHCHMTIVREAGSGKTMGLVTLEDIIEELVGELDDEFDPLPRTFYSPGESFWVVGGGISMSQLARDTNLDLPCRAEPVSAWFARNLKRQPRVGDQLSFRNADFYVRKLRRSQVLEFNVKRRAIGGISPKSME